jgi:hypothetical protein
VTGDDVVLRPYADTLADGAPPPPGLQFASRSAFVDRESVPAVLQILAEVRASERSPFIAVRSVGGAVSRVPAGATAYAHRRAELMLVTTSAGPAPAVEAARPALDAIWGRLAPHISGAYGNFLATATEADVAAMYPLPTRARLAAVKRQYDPATCSPAITTSGRSTRRARPCMPNGGTGHGEFSLCPGSQASA